MNKTRTEVSKLLDNMKWFKERHTFFSDDIISLSSQAEYDRTIAHYEHVIAELNKMLEKCPVGYRYTGKYFLKVAYVMPPQFEEGNGSLFMREDLVSWQVEKEDGQCEYSYHRAVFKEPYGDRITRADAEPVYPKD